MFKRILSRAKGVMDVILRPQKYYAEIKKCLTVQLPYTPSKGQILWCYFDYLWFRLKYAGSIQPDYFKTQMYRKSGFVRKESLAHSARFPWRDSIQARECWPIFTDKRKFYEAFSEYMNRDWMVADGDTPWEKFREFLEGKEQIFTKLPISGGGGRCPLSNGKYGGKETRAV